MLTQYLSSQAGHPDERSMPVGRLRSRGGADSLAENGREDPTPGSVSGTLDGLATTEVGFETYLTDTRGQIRADGRYGCRPKEPQ